MDEVQLIAIVAAILASNARNAVDAGGYWEGGKDREAGIRHKKLMTDATLDAIDLVRDLPQSIADVDRIAAEEAEDHAGKQLQN
ncbi:MAG: hypothetical protein MUP80_09100 [Acidobacteriia bacterium]|nr:hypothetical protein [Terriglobia bacterium]